ncbi:ribosomal protein S18 acetylase RimI-like enzyme [Brevundimonas nasdae]|uniref:GNAT family acetyltransferase n=1 Tax=Brevundimonas nasdae TaxID=172043 RepID=UPI001911DF4C|nr:GNAT family acetyltransferase [Brevundimonas nasdae]MBK6024047.1 GNAT family acetyltransferase [Brevundimonas nasdae]MDQ0450703.1 ribosomal protein S18 acetylase RimI-like enzyme [Brevundimonas nasdae]
MNLIRPISDGDEAAVIALWSACDLTRPWNDPAQDLRLARDTATSAILVATDDDRIIGTVMTGFEGHRGWVYYLAVDPAYRGAGLGRLLMTAAEAWLKAQGAPKLQLMVRADNAAALGFYERLGLERQDVVVLGRRLDGR